MAGFSKDKISCQNNTQNQSDTDGTLLSHGQLA
jgi:hypothetical protein